MIQNMIDLIQTQAEFSGHDLDQLEHGLIPFVTIKQVGFICGLLRKCDVPEEWQLWLTGQLVGRELRSRKDMSMAEASAVIAYLLVGSDGKGDEESKEPCDEAKEIIGQMLMHVMANGVSKMVARKEGGARVEVVQQLGLC